MNNLHHRHVDPTLLLREAMARRLYRRSVVTGEITLPAAPGMIDEYVRMCDTLFAGVGRRFTAEQLGHLQCHGVASDVAVTGVPPRARMTALMR